MKPAKLEFEIISRCAIVLFLGPIKGSRLLKNVTKHAIMASCRKKLATLVRSHDIANHGTGRENQTMISNINGLFDIGSEGETAKEEEIFPITSCIHAGVITYSR